MSSQTQLDQEEVVQEVFPGAEFAAAREAKGLDVQDVANALNFSASHIMAIEEGRLDALPSRVFALGYLRAYARHVGLDENKAVEDYERLTGNEGKAASKPLKSVSSVGAEPVKSKRGGLKGLVFASLIAGAAAVGYWWTQQSAALEEPAPVAQMKLPTDDAAPSETIAETTAVPATSEVESDESIAVETDNLAEEEALGETVVPNAEVASSEPGAAEQVVEPVAGTVESETIVPEPAVAESAVEANAAKAVSESDAVVNVSVPVSAVTAEVGNEEAAPIAVGEGHLKITFNAECWVEVRDDTGRLLVASVRSPARGVDVRGKAPMKITLGAVSAVDNMIYNNDAVALDQRGSGNVLRMTLPVVE